MIKKQIIEKLKLHTNLGTKVVRLVAMFLNDFFVFHDRMIDEAYEATALRMLQTPSSYLGVLDYLCSSDTTIGSNYPLAKKIISLHPEEKDLLILRKKYKSSCRKSCLQKLLPFTDVGDIRIILMKYSSTPGEEVCYEFDHHTFDLVRAQENRKETLNWVKFFALIEAQKNYRGWKVSSIDVDYEYIFRKRGKFILNVLFVEGEQFTEDDPIGCRSL
jgi:hypothetical protein